MSGIRDLIPGSVIDATMFNPCGYSMNGMKTDVSVSLLTRLCRANDLNASVMWLCLSPPGNLLDHPHHPRAGVLLRQLRNQPVPDIIRWSGQEGGGGVQARKICDYAFCQSGMFLKYKLVFIQRDSVIQFVTEQQILFFPPFCLPLQSSKCRSVFSSAQKLEGYKRLDRQLAQFNDYNFVFTSYAQNRQQNQQSWGLKMKKRRKKKGDRPGLPPCGRLHPPVESLSSSPRLLHLLPPFCCCRRSESPGADTAGSPSLTSSLSCLHCCTCDLVLLHESSFLCFDILAHSCCDLEVHVEELNTLCLRLSTCTQYNGPFLQVSPLIPHRQGFRPH